MIIDFTKPTGLNSDDDRDFLPNGDSPVTPGMPDSGRLNVIMEDGNIMSIVNTQGNELESYSLPSGTNKVIGCVEDIDNNGIIYFVYNSNNNHCILRYNYDATFTVISINQSIWNFTENSKITARIIDGYLIWTDSETTEEVRQVILSKLINSEYAYLDKGKINLIKPYGTYIDTTYLSDTSISFNNIKDKLYQFTFRLVFDNDQKSAWSMYSRTVPRTSRDEGGNYLYRANGLFAVINTLWNYIQLNLQWKYNNVAKVEIAFRYADIGGGVPSVWYFYDSKEVTSSDFDTTYDFYDDKDRYALNQDEFLYLYDDVPLADSLEIINDNRVVLANLTKDYDNIDINLTIDDVTDELRGSFTQSRFKLNAAATNTLSGFYPKPSDGYHKVSIFSVEKGIEQHILSSDIEYSTASDVIDYFVDRLNNHSSYNLTVINFSGTGLRITNNEAFAIGCTYKSYNFSETITTLSDGATHYFCIFYKDDMGRVSRAQTSGTSFITIPAMTERYGTYAGNYYDISSKVKMTIGHLPPSWATGYCFGYGGSNIFKRFAIPMIVKSENINIPADVTRDLDSVYINLSAMINRLYLDRYKVDINTFNVASGDRFRVCGYYDYTNKNVVMYDATIDLAVKSVNGSGVVVLDNWNGVSIESSLNGESTENVILVEFYRIDKDVEAENLVYKEIDYYGDITGGYHKAIRTSTNYGVTAQDQTSVNDCITFLEFGDVYYAADIEHFELINYSTLLIDTVFGGVISMYFSYLFNSMHDNTGRVNIEDKEYSRRTLKALMYGGAYSSEGVTFNELNKFKSKDIVFLDDKFGDISSVVQDGYTLNAIQQRKITSLFIGRQETTLTDGTKQLVASSQVLSTPNPLGEQYGSIFPVVKNDRNIYGYDIYSGIVWRKSPNGVEDISRYKMKNYFRNKSKELLDSGLSNVDVIGGWDEISQMYYITFIKEESADVTETLGFHEPTNRWFSFYSFVPELYGKIGNNIFLTFKDGKVYKHYSSTSNRDYFYGVQYSHRIIIVINDQPQLTKHFDSIEEDSNVVWSADNSGDILVDGEFVEWTNPNDYTRHKASMSSRLKAYAFKAWEGIFRAYFLRDETTRGTANQYDLLNGRPLKGRSLIIKLANSYTGKAILRMVNVKWRESK